MIPIDETDRKILRILQSDASLPIREIAERVGLSQAPCWRRINALRESGVIIKQVAVLDRSLLGLPFTVFVRVKLQKLTREAFEEFEKGALALPELQELQMVTNENSYRLRIVVGSFEDYESFLRDRLSRLPHVQDILTNFVVSEPKYTFELPI